MSINHLFVGDSCSILADQACAHDADAKLITAENFEFEQFINWPSATYYTSLADLELPEFVKCLDLAEKIQLVEPAQWSHHTIKNLTLELLQKYNNSELAPDRTALDVSMLQLADYKKTSGPHLYVAGCSIPYGTGLADGNLKFGNLVADRLNLPVVDLNRPGTSISWSADQIIRSDIESSDTLIWMVTAVNRVTWIKHDAAALCDKLDVIKCTGITPTNLNNRVGSSKEKTFFEHYLLEHTHLLTTAVQAVDSVIKFCRRNKIKCVICLAPISLPEHQLALKRIFKSSSELVDIEWTSLSQPGLDLADDGLHPGPIAHQYIADQLLKHL